MEPTSDKLSRWCSAFNTCITIPELMAVPYRDLHSDMIRISWKGHTVALFFDTDSPTAASYTIDAVITTIRKYPDVLN